MLLELILGLLTILYLVYIYITRKHGYWKKKGVVFIEPTFPLALLQKQFLGKADAGAASQEYYTKYKSQGLKYVGGYLIRDPTLILLDLDLCKNVLTKDFHNFVTRGAAPLTHEYISEHLFSLTGNKWRVMRTKLTPTFTSGKMKNMFLLMEKCAEQLQEHIDDFVLEKGEFEVKDLIARFTTDIIATCAFGLEVNSIKHKDDEFFKTGQLIFRPRKSIFLKLFMYNSFPILSKHMKISFFLPRVSDHLTTIIKDTVKYRKQNNVSRNDFVDLLIKVKENKSLEDQDNEKDEGDSNHSCILRNVFPKAHESHEQGLTLEEMTAQAFVFFAAGFETAASTTSFCLYELAKNKEVQERLRREVDEVLANHDGRISYQALQEMTYMDQVLNETLRMYASLPLLNRVCTEKYQFPGTDLTIEEGVRIQIPSYAIHHDPDIYPDPYTFDPDRFSEENSRNRHPYAFIPFGEGPRICIGMRFGKLQVKIGLAAILSKYELTPASDTPSKLEINPLIVFTTPKHPFSLNISKRTDL